MKIEETNSHPNATMFTKLSKDLIVAITLFLEPYEVQRLCLTCKCIEGEEGIHEYWYEVASRRNALCSSSSSQLELAFFSKQPTVAKGFVLSDLRRQKDGKIENLLHYIQIDHGNGVVEASSIDREEENALNTLKISRCAILQSALQEDDTRFNWRTRGYIAQEECQCCYQNPCYWSSCPSKTPIKDEYISFQFRNSVNFKDNRIPCIQGISVTPYQAFFHPDSPVYTPQYVLVQLYIPIKEKEHDCDQKEETKTSDIMYYESELFEFDGSPNKQTFPLNNVLFLGGEVRLVFRNFLQRQTLDLGEGNFLSLSLFVSIDF